MNEERTGNRPPAFSDSLNQANQLNSIYDTTRRDIHNVRKQLSSFPPTPSPMSPHHYEEEVSVSVDFSQLVDEDDIEVSVNYDDGEIKDRMRRLTEGKSEIERLWKKDSEPVHQRLLKEGMDREFRKSKKRMQVVKKERKDHKLKLTSQAKRIKRHQDVVEHLLSKKGEYDARRERLKQQLALEERKETTKLFKPQINPQSKSMKREEPAHDRLHRHSKESLIKIEKLKNMLRERKEKEFVGKPQINDLSKRIYESTKDQNQSHVDRMLMWEEQRKEKIKMLREEAKKKNYSENTHRPKINPLSNRIAKLSSNRNRVAVEDRLLQYREQKIYEQEEKKFEMVMKAQKRAHPKINKKSQSFMGSEDSFDDISNLNSPREDPFSRLYYKAFEMAHKKRQKADSFRKASSIDDKTGQKLYTPFINARSAALIRNAPVEEILHMKGENSKLRKQQQDYEIQQSLKKSAKSVHMGAYSQLLTQIRENRSNESAKDRLLRPTGSISDSTIQSLQEQDSSFTFKPSINETSRKIDREQRIMNGSISSNRYHHLMEKQQEYEQNKKRLQEQLLAEELSECSFRPTQNKSKQSKHFVSQYRSPYKSP